MMNFETKVWVKNQYGEKNFQIFQFQKISAVFLDIWMKKTKQKKNEFIYGDPQTSITGSIGFTKQESSTTSWYTNTKTTAHGRRKTDFLADVRLFLWSRNTNISPKFKNVRGVPLIERKTFWVSQPFATMCENFLFSPIQSPKKPSMTSSHCDVICHQNVPFHVSSESDVVFSDSDWLLMM